MKCSRKTSLISCVTGTWPNPSEIPYFHNPSKYIKVPSSQIHDSRVREDQTGFSHVFLHNVLVIVCSLADAAPLVYGLYWNRARRMPGP